MSQREAVNRLKEVAHHAKASVHGVEAVEYTHHARLVTTAIEAFGDDPDAAFFVESLPPSVRIPRPDLVIAHPSIGVLVIENKGISISDIHDVRADELSILRDGSPQWEHPFMQAEKVMFKIKDLLKKQVGIKSITFNRMAALSAISDAAFKARFGGSWEFHTIFADALDDPADFRIYVSGFVDNQSPNLFADARIGPNAIAALRSIFTGTAALWPPRARRSRKVASPAPATPESTPITPEMPAAPTFGDHIHALDSQPRQHTEQQKELLRVDPRFGHRLFRGVAGSGKSVILAGMVARTLRRIVASSDAEPQLLVCCYNRTLVHFLSDKIDTELSRLCWDTLSPKMIRVVHYERLVRDLIKQEPRLRTKYGFNNPVERAKAIVQAWDAMPEADRQRLRFDAVFVDEAQDLEPAEFELLRRLAISRENGEQALTIFYDNAQNIYGKLTPTWEHLGINIVGRTTYLDECLRNTRQTLELAMNVLVGSCAPAGVRATTRQFADLANLRSRGLIDETEDRIGVRFCRRQGSSPVVRQFGSRRDETRWVVDEIERLIRDQSVSPAEILVLYQSHKDFVPNLPMQLAALAGKLEFAVRMVDKDHPGEKDAPLIQPGVLTTSTIASAKGYDAPIVFLIGCDRLDVDTRGRALFYVGATRARHLLYVTGIDADQNTLVTEAKMCLDTMVGHAR